MLGIITSQLQQAEKDLQDQLKKANRKKTKNKISVPPPAPLPSDEAARNAIRKNSEDDVSNNDDCNATAAASINPGSSSNSTLTGEEDGKECENEGVDEDKNKDNDNDKSSSSESSDEGSEDSTDEKIGDDVKKKREKRFAYVYLIWSESMDFVKFGKCNALASRFRKRYKTVRSLLHFNKENY